MALALLSTNPHTSMTTHSGSTLLEDGKGAWHVLEDGRGQRFFFQDGDRRLCIGWVADGWCDRCQLCLESSRLGVRGISEIGCHTFMHCACL